MPGRDVEIILLKQLASCLAIPIFVAGPDGELLFFNESAESILGQRYDEWQAMDRHEWGALIRTTDAAGQPLPDSERPMLAALDKREPIHNHFWIEPGDGVRRELEGSAFPLVGRSGSPLGALGLFWEPGRERLGVPDAPELGGSQEVEVILMRRLASHLATPILIQDAQGELLYFNSAAEPILGIAFAQLRVTSRDERYETFRPTDLDGELLSAEAHPLNIARERGEPAHRRFWISGLDGVRREIEGTAFPLIGQSRRMLGSVGLFWEIGPS